MDDYLNFSGNIFPFCVVRYFKTFVDIQMLISQQNHSNVVNEEEHNLNFSSENHHHRLGSRGSRLVVKVPLKLDKNV